MPLETIPDPARVAPAEVPFVNPLWQELEAPAAPKGPPPRLEDLEASGALVIGVRIDETGKVSEAVVSGRLGVLALGYLRHEGEPPAAAEVDTAAGAAAAKIVDLPFAV